MGIKTYNTSVKASKLIAALQAKAYETKVVESGDLYPCLYSVNVLADEKTHVCTLLGLYSWREDDVKYSVDSGCSAVTVMGVTFSKPILNSEDEDIKLSGRAIVYDNDLQEDDVLAAADEAITFVDYDPDMFPFDEDGVTDDELVRCLEWGSDGEVFAINADGDVCAFSRENEVPRNGFRRIETDEAYELLAKTRPGITYDVGC